MRCYTEINNIQVENRIFTAKFCCDYEKCEGACCNKPLPDEELNGGHLTNDEAAEILYHRKAISFLCDEEVREIAMKKPVTKSRGHYFTTLQEQRCVLCSMKQGTCVLKIAKEKKIADTDIPLSCQLYPILWEEYPQGERLSISNLFDKDYCVHAYEKGKQEGVFLLDFLKVPLIRGFGIDFYDKLKEIQKDFL